MYTADEWGVSQADNYTAALTRRMEKIAEQPQLGSSIRGLPDIYRRIKADRHRIIYRYDEVALTIVRILHERQDVPEAGDLD